MNKRDIKLQRQGLAIYFHVAWVSIYYYWHFYVIFYIIAQCNKAYLHYKKMQQLPWMCIQVNLSRFHVCFRSWPGLFQPGVWLGESGCDVWCHQHRGYTGPPGPPSAPQVYNHALCLRWDVRGTPTSFCFNLNKSFVDNAWPWKCAKSFEVENLCLFVGTLTEASTTGCASECLNVNEWVWNDRFHYVKDGFVSSLH